MEKVTRRGFMQAIGAGAAAMTGPLTPATRPVVALIDFSTILPEAGRAW